MTGARILAIGGFIAGMLGMIGGFVAAAYSGSIGSFMIGLANLTMLVTNVIVALRKQ